MKQLQLRLVSNQMCLDHYYSFLWHWQSFANCLQQNFEKYLFKFFEPFKLYKILNPLSNQAKNIGKFLAVILWSERKILANFSKSYCKTFHWIRPKFRLTLSKTKRFESVSKWILQRTTLCRLKILDEFSTIKMLVNPGLYVKVDSTYDCM